MNDPEKTRTGFHRWVRYLWALAVVWTVVIAVSLIWNVTQVRQNTLEAARIQAQAAYEKDVIYRRWNAGHGGVYVPVAEGTQPNPYLTNVVERDITTPSGKLLTLMNPAYMTRQAHELAEKEQGVRGHITSLNPIRPENAADPWETGALQAFEDGETEVSSVEEMEGIEYMRMMRPLITEKGCLKCHATQGYQEGDIRGGISVSIPMKPLWAIASKNRLTLWLGHGLLWLVGLAGIGLGGQRLRRSEEERERAEKGLKKAKEEAERANRAKSAFFTNMSHELRTPLNATLGFSQLMNRSRSLDSEQRENLAIINRSGEHLLTLINDVLTMSKIEAGRTTLNEDSFNLYRLLDDLQDMFWLKAGDKGLQLSFDRAPNVPQYVRTDGIKLRQVLINLLNNAIKFTEDGGVLVRVRCAEGDRLYFEVEDTGSGISADELETVFEPFVQTETGQQATEGTGLGLPISRQFVQLMGGALTASSPPFARTSAVPPDRGGEEREGPGSVFRFDIHINVVAASEVGTKQPTRRVMALEPNQPRYRILIVDDKRYNRQLLIKLLAPLGFELREAGNGQEAIEVWEDWDPHLVWMDMRMPVLDGYEATRRIKGTTKGQATAIIALTASTLEEERVVILSTGCDDFVRKPFRETKIFEVMNKHIGVRYVYEEPESALALAQTAGDVLTPAALTALPPDLLANLEQATVHLDVDEIANVIDQIRTHDASVADALLNLADDLGYVEILDFIQAAKEPR